MKPLFTEAALFGSLVNWCNETFKEKAMDQDKAFEEYWAKEAERLDPRFGTMKAVLEKRFAREVWYGALNAQPDLDPQKALNDHVELAWFRSVCAEEMGVDAPGGEACHPLRDWLKEFKAHDRASPPAVLLAALALRMDASGVLGEAGLLAEKKTGDYDDGESRDDYFPLGLASYAQMVHVKSRRLVLAAKRPRELNFESVRDTCIDLINYASFAADWLRRHHGKPTNG